MFNMKIISTKKYHQLIHEISVLKYNRLCSKVYINALEKCKSLSENEKNSLEKKIRFLSEKVNTLSTIMVEMMNDINEGKNEKELKKKTKKRKK